MLPTSIDDVPPAPREPSPRARALIFDWRPGQSVQLFVGVFFVILGSVFTVAFGGEVPQDLLIDLHPVRQQGMLLSKQVDLQESVNGVHPTVLQFSYFYGGQRYEAESNAMRQLPRIDPDDQTLDIEVAKDHPAFARARGTTRSWAGYSGALALLMPLLGLWIIYKALTLRWAAARAFTDGVPAMADVVFAGEDLRTRINGRRPWMVRWKFELEGRLYRGSIRAMDKAALAELLAAKTLVVLYDPANPRRNTVYVGD